MVVRIKRLLMGVSSILAAGGLLANDIEPGKEYYTAIKAPVPIVLDGDLSEWRGAALLADPRFSIPKGSGEGGVPTDAPDGGELVFFEKHGGGDWTGPDDHTSAVQVVYDDDNVYFGFTVTDEYHENARNSPWNGDSVQLMIADDEREQIVALYNYALGGTEEELGEEAIVQHERSPESRGEVVTEAVVVRNTETKRTVYEIKLPKQTLDLETLQGGVRFGLGMAINDGDEATPGQKGWGGLGAHSIVFGKSPQETALVTLATSNDIEPGKEYYTANPKPADVVIDGVLDEWSGIPVLSDPRFSVPKGSKREGDLTLFEKHGGGDWTGPDDHTSAVQISYDDDNVYFGFTVTDEYHENARNSPWNGDSIQLMTANRDQNEIITLLNYALGGVEEDLGETIVQTERVPPDSENLTEAVVLRNTETKRTVYEIRLGKGAVAPEADKLDLGVQFGLGMAINDGDKETPGQKGWGGLGAHSIVFGKSPGETALVTLGIGGFSSDLLFLSAINLSADTFSFRATDKGESIVDPASAKLTLNGEEVVLVAGEKRLDATDFSYTSAETFEPGMAMTYVIEIADGDGNVVTDAGTITTPVFGLLRAPMKAVDYDTSQPGFLWSIWQSELFIHTSLGEVEMVLAGEAKDIDGSDLENDADPDQAGAAIGGGEKSGALVRFEIEDVINFNLPPEGEPGDGVGNFRPDGDMPGLPGLLGWTDGVSAEILTFVEFPEGVITMGVNSDDGFRVEVGYIDDRDNVMTAGEFNGGRGASDTTFLMDVRSAGVYPVRIVYYNGRGGANIELFTVKEDGTKVLVNDVANGGLKAWRAGTVPEKPDLPTEFSIGVRVADSGKVELYWDVDGLTLQQSSDLSSWTDVAGAASPHQPATGSAAQFFRLRH